MCAETRDSPICSEFGCPQLFLSRRHPSSSCLTFLPIMDNDSRTFRKSNSFIFPRSSGLLAVFHFASRLLASVLNSCNSESITCLCNTETAPTQDKTTAARNWPLSKHSIDSSKKDLVSGLEILGRCCLKDEAILGTLLAAEGPTMSAMTFLPSVVNSHPLSVLTARPLLAPNMEEKFHLLAARRPELVASAFRSLTLCAISGSTAIQIRVFSRRPYSDTAKRSFSLDLSINYPTPTFLRPF